MFHIESSLAGLKEYLTMQMPIMPWPGGDKHPKGRTVTVGRHKAVLFEVSSSDPMRYRMAARKIGYFFYNELHHDTPPYLPRRQPDDIMFMWIDTDYTLRKKAIAYGVCGFSPLTNHENKDGWELSWAWFHPYERRRGHLSNAWPYFLERFGLFSVQTPWSVGMQEFLKKRTTRLYRYPDAFIRRRSELSWQRKAAVPTTGS